MQQRRSWLCRLRLRCAHESCCRQPDRPRTKRAHLKTEFWLLLRREVLPFAGAFPPPAWTMARICRSSWLRREVLLLCCALVRRLDVGLPFDDAPLFRLLELRREACGLLPGGLTAGCSGSSCAAGRMQANMAPAGGLTRPLGLLQLRQCFSLCQYEDSG